MPRPVPSTAPSTTRLVTARGRPGPAPAPAGPPARPAPRRGRSALANSGRAGPRSRAGSAAGSRRQASQASAHADRHAGQRDQHDASEVDQLVGGAGEADGRAGGDRRPAGQGRQPVPKPATRTRAARSARRAPAPATHRGRRLVRRAAGAARRAEEDPQPQPGRVPGGDHHGGQPGGVDQAGQPARCRQRRRRRIASLLQKPASGGRPTSAPSPIVIVQKVTGMARRSPPIARHQVGADRVDHRPGGEEQQRLERGVGEQVEQRRRRRADGQRPGHVAQLGDGRPGQHPLDVVLGGGGERAEQHGDRGHHRRARPARAGAACEDRVEPGHHVDAGGDHGGGVDQGGDRGRAGHRVGQPGVQRELGALAGDAGQQQQRRRR